MKRYKWSVVSVLMLVLSGLLYVPEADARRFGGGSSFGRSSGALFKRSTPVAPAKPAPAAPSRAANGSATNQVAAGAGTSPARRSFMGPLGGLAAGLGLAALFGYMGFGEGLASMLGTGLMLLLGFLLLRKLFSMFRQSASARTAGQPAFAGAGGAGAPSFDRSVPQSFGASAS
ncbi:MAG: hypothetical protein HC848_05760, partial [Limnobacter sp.]|nr:hypothetical protein [Limnobacter sp.]